MYKTGQNQVVTIFFQLCNAKPHMRNKFRSVNSSELRGNTDHDFTSKETAAYMKKEFKICIIR